MAQLVKNLPAMQEKTWVRFLGWEDPLEKGTATYSSILACEFHGLYSPWSRKELDTTEQLSHFTYAAGAHGHTSGDIQALQEGKQLYPLPSTLTSQTLDLHSSSSDQFPCPEESRSRFLIKHNSGWLK